MLTDSEIRKYKEEGYLKVGSVFSIEELQPVRDAIQRLLDEARELGIRETTKLYELELKADHSEGPVVKRLQFIWDKDPAFENLAASEKILSRLEDLIGPDIEMHHTKAYLKPPSHGTKVGIHQDYPFFPHSNDDVLAVMVYLDDSTEENGCLCVVPRSHKEEVFPHFDDQGQFAGRIPDEIAKGLFDKAVKLEAKAGDLTIHNYRTIHFSGPNQSSQSRWVVNLQYRAADAVDLVHPLLQEQDPCFGVLVRGRHPFRARLRTGESIILPNRGTLPYKLPRTSDVSS